MKYALVATPAELQAAARVLDGAPRYYLDTEFDSAPGSRRLALLQVARDAEFTFLVDPLRVTDLEPLARALGRPDAEWVLHAGKQDVELLLAAFKLGAAPRLFDTQVAWGLLGPEYPVSLAYLLYRILGLRGDKGEQAGDWMRRPLTPEQLAYAAEDVAHLPALHEHLMARLRDAGREAAAVEASAELNAPEMEAAATLDDFRNAWQLDGPGLAVLQHLIGLQNADPDESLPPRVLLSVAKLIPETVEELSRIKGVPWAWAKRNGAGLVNTLIRISAEAAKQAFEPLEPPPYATWPEILAEGAIRDAVAKVSAALEVSPELLFPGRLIRTLVKKAAAAGRPEAAVEALTGWRRTLAADEWGKVFRSP